MSSDPTFAPTVDEDARRRFEAAWRAAKPEPIEHFLPAEDHPHHLATLEELAAIEMEFLWKATPPGNGTIVADLPPRVEAYLARFPRLNQPEIVRRLLRQELALRRQRGERPSTDEYRARFPEIVAAGQELDATLATDAPAAPVRPLILPGYEILEEIARGGMGVVYKARQTGLNRLAAVKMILAGARAGPATVARFRVEAEAVARVRHPHIVQIYEVGACDGLPFLALEYVEGGSLAQKIAHTPPPARAAAEMVETLARAVLFAHQQGVLHRDLKPANVLLAADGTPKIADFGLAKRLESDAGQTRTGEIVGTPSYMAPEQAAPGSSPIGTPADVWALGAILYELLTGRPPFQAKTAWDVLTRVATADPAPPRRLRPKTPADLETICLKCLRKEPQRRYGSAEALADDLRRFLTGRPIQARRVGVVERAVKWVRRNTVVAALLAVVVLAMTVGVGGWLWAARDRADRLQRAERTAAVALGKMKEDEDQAAAVERTADEKGQEEPETPETANRALQLRRQAVESLDEAERALADVLGAAEAQARTAERRPAIKADLHEAERTAGLLSDLDRARGARAATTAGAIDTASAARFYEAALAAYGLDVSRPEEETAAAVRKARPGIRLALVMALDDWASCIRLRDVTEAERLGRIAGGADDDDWRRRCRAEAGDIGALKRLAKEAPGLHLPAVSLIHLARDLRDRGASSEAAALLRAARREHPTDFWVYFDLAVCLHTPNPRNAATLDEAEGCACAAVALRPDSSTAQNNLGTVLLHQGDLDGAADCFHKAVELDPMLASAQSGLGNVQYERGDRDGAAACYRKAIEIDPSYTLAQNNLGLVLADQGDRDGAAACYRKVIELDPKNAWAHFDLGNVLYDQGDRDGAAASYQKAIELDPKNAHPHAGLGLIDLLQGKFAWAREQFQRSLDLPGLNDAQRAESADRLQRCDRLLALEQKLGPVLRGEKQPADDAERMGLAQVCQLQRRYAAAARFRRAAFAHDPELADDLKSAYRYDAACCAARAGCGQGEDAGELDDKERAGWRKQALDWLRADLDRRVKQVDGGKPEDQQALAQKLRFWQKDPDLAGLRDAAELAKLPADEQEAWREFWSDVQSILDNTGDKK